MILIAKIKKIGDKQSNTTRIKLPDDCKAILEKYELDMVEFPTKGIMSLYFKKNDLDVYSYTINRYNNPLILKEGFKNAIDGLKLYDDALVDDDEKS